MAEQFIVGHGLETAPVFLGASTVYRLLDLDELINALEKALGRFSEGPSGGIDMPVRSTVTVRKSSFLGVMPGFSDKDDSLATKLVCLFPGNSEKNLPTHSAVVVLFDAGTGVMKAMMDGGVITALRTAATSAVVVRQVVPKTARILTILGSGVQARSHALALRRVHQFEEVRIWSGNVDHAKSCADDVGGVVFDSAKAAVEGADVIVTVTLKTSPVLLGEWVKPGAIVTAVGACRPDQREMDDTLMQKSVVLVDSRAAAMKESGDVLLSGATIFAEVGEVVNGTKTVLPGSTVVFKSLGLAIEDVISAKLVYDKYTASTSA